MPVNFHWCQSAFEYWPGSTDIFRGASLAMLLLGGTSFLSFIGILLWLHVQKRRALRGADAAYHSSPLIFPLYNKVLWCGAAATLIDTTCSLFVPTATGLGRWREEENAGSEPDARSKLLAAALYGGVWACYHFVFEGVAFLMLSPGVGTNAARKSAALAGAWAAITWFVQSWASHNGGTLSSILLSVSWSASLVLFYGALWLLPLSKLFRRPCVYHYARFWCLMRIFTALSNVMRHYDLSVGFCFFIASTAAFQSPTVAFVVYKCLLRDCQYWLGILSWGAVPASSSTGDDKPADAEAQTEETANESLLSLGGGGSSGSNNNASMESLRRPLLGTSLAPHSARMLAQKMDSSKRSLRGAARTSAIIAGTSSDGSTPSASTGGSSFLGSPLSSSSSSASKKKGGVRVLNFAFLRIDQPVAPSAPGAGAGSGGPNRPQQVVLGSGSSCRVFQGTFRKRPVAIKMIFVPELTPETVASFYHEATLLAQLSHPNVVDVLGVCVLPPAICLVMELCAGGNLFDYLRQAQAQHQTLSLQKQIALASDCSEAVAFLHRQVPAVLHLDIKSLNFLLTREARVKIADLELSREIMIATEAPSAQGQGVGGGEEEQQRAQAQAHSQLQHPYLGSGPVRSAGGVTQSPAAAYSSHSSSTTPAAAAVVSGSELTGFKLPETLYWLAPELILGLPYSEKADVYALALVVWEIWTALVPYRSLEDSLVLAARSARFLELCGVPHGCAPGPEEAASLNRATGGKFRYGTGNFFSANGGDSESGDDSASVSSAGTGGGVTSGGSSRRHSGATNHSGYVHGGGRGRAESAGSSSSAASYATVATNASERLPPSSAGVGPGAWKTAPPSAFSNGAPGAATAPTTATTAGAGAGVGAVARRERKYSHSSSRSRRAYEGEEEEMQSTPSSAGSNRSSAPSPQSPRYFLSGAGTGFFGPPVPPASALAAAAAAAGAGVGAVAVPAVAASAIPAAGGALGTSPPALSDQPPSALVLPTPAPAPAPGPAVHPGASAGAGAGAAVSALALTRENLISLDAAAHAGAGAGLSVDPYLRRGGGSGSFSPPVLELEQEPDPILAEWKRQHHIITHRVVAAHHHQHEFDSSPGAGPTRSSSSSQASPAMFGAAGAMRAGAGGAGLGMGTGSGRMPYSMRPTLPTVPASVTSSLMADSAFPTPSLGLGTPFQLLQTPQQRDEAEQKEAQAHAHAHAQAQAQQEPRPSSPLSEECSMSASDLSHSYSRSGIDVAHSLGAGGGGLGAGATGSSLSEYQGTHRGRGGDRQPLIQRSAPFSSDLSPIRASMREPAFGTADPADELSLPPTAFPAAGTPAPPPMRQFSAPSPAGPSARSTESYQQYTYIGGSELDAASAAEWTGDHEAGANGDATSSGGGGFAYSSTMPLSRSMLLPSGGNTNSNNFRATSPAALGAHEDGSARQSGAPSPTPSQSQRVPRVTNNLSLRSTQPRRSTAVQSGDSKKKKKRTQGGGRGASGSGSSGSGGGDLSGRGSAGRGGGAVSRPVVDINSIYVSRHDIQSQLRHLICVEHYRPTLPPDMPDELAALLQRAWHPAPHCRPAAAEFVATLARLAAALNEQTQTYMAQHNHAFNNHTADRRNQM